MRTIKVNLGKRSYKIIVGTDILKELPKYISALGIGKDAYIITNKFLRIKYGKKMEEALKKSGFSVRFKLVPDTETSKSFNMVNVVLNDIAGYDKRKQIFIISFGGGVIGDLSGIVASIYKRGIPYIQVPTTLLAQVDSSIGGKTAVDLNQGKNLVGTFYQPRLVLSDVELLRTLDLRQLKAGLAEVIKYGIIKDKQLFSYLENHFLDILERKTPAFTFIVRRCSSIKAGIVEKDEKEEKGLRTILNFGHTLGHAIEAAGGFRGYNHGEAVALGILCAALISKKLGMLSDESLLRIESLIRAVGLPRKIIPRNRFLFDEGLQSCGKKLTLSGILKAYYHDKKFKNARNRFVLIQGIGKTKIVEDIPLRIIKEVLRRRI
jgi:3-dehydroquinate synthase